MAQKLPEQSPNITLSELLKAHLRRRGWTAGKLANECGIAVLATKKRAFEACGALYSAGLSKKAKG